MKGLATGLVLVILIGCQDLLAGLYPNWNNAEEQMAEEIQAKIENYRTAPFDARFPNQNQTRNCWSNYLDFHRCEKALEAKGVDTAPCDWYKRVYRSLCPGSWVQKWEEQKDEGTFAGKV